MIIAGLAAIAQASYGNVDLVKGLAIGLPAIGGVIAGTALQQRLSDEVVARAFVVLLVVSAAILIF